MPEEMKILQTAARIRANLCGSKWPIRLEVIRAHMAYDSQRQDVRERVYVDAGALRLLLTNANFLSRKGYHLFRPSNFNLFHFPNRDMT